MFGVGPDEGRRIILTFAVLKTSSLQSCRMLMDQAGRSYWAFPKVIFAENCGSKFERNAAQPPDFG